MKERSTDVIDALGEVGAIIKGSHFVYTSGKHGEDYVAKDVIYPHVGLTDRVALLLAEKFADLVVDTVIAPAVGGVVLANRVASCIERIKGREVFAVYADKEGDNNFVIKRGYGRFIAGKHVLVVEDVLTTGGSAKVVIERVREAGGDVVGLGVICNRGNVTPKDVGGVPRLYALLETTMSAWDEDKCPLCANGIPINEEFGKGREFVARLAKSKTRRLDRRSD